METIPTASVWKMDLPVAYDGPVQTNLECLHLHKRRRMQNYRKVMERVFYETKVHPEWPVTVKIFDEKMEFYPLYGRKVPLAEIRYDEVISVLPSRDRHRVLVVAIPAEDRNKVWIVGMRFHPEELREHYEWRAIPNIMPGVGIPTSPIIDVEEEVVEVEESVESSEEESIIDINEAPLEPRKFDHDLVCSYIYAASYKRKEKVREIKRDRDAFYLVVPENLDKVDLYSFLMEKGMARELGKEDFFVILRHPTGPMLPKDLKFVKTLVNVQDNNFIRILNKNIPTPNLIEKVCLSSPSTPSSSSSSSYSTSSLFSSSGTGFEKVKSEILIVPGKCPTSLNRFVITPIEDEIPIPPPPKIPELIVPTAQEDLPEVLPETMVDTKPQLCMALANTPRHTQGGKLKLGKWVSDYSESSSGCGNADELNLTTESDLEWKQGTLKLTPHSNKSPKHLVEVDGEYLLGKGVTVDCAFDPEDIIHLNRIFKVSKRHEENPPSLRRVCRSRNDCKPRKKFVCHRQIYQPEMVCDCVNIVPSLSRVVHTCTQVMCENDCYVTPESSYEASEYEEQPMGDEQFEGSCNCCVHGACCCGCCSVVSCVCVCKAPRKERHLRSSGAQEDCLDDVILFSKSGNTRPMTISSSLRRPRSLQSELLFRKNN